MVDPEIGSPKNRALFQAVSRGREQKNPLESQLLMEHPFTFLNYLEDHPI